MTAAEFDTFWRSTYPDTVPMGYRFRYNYHDRWFRIHSLPDSKRYAVNPEEWGILLDRHNTIITDLLGEQSPVLFVTGEYHWDNLDKLEPILIEPLGNIPFITSALIDLHQLSPGEYKAGEFFRPVFCDLLWQNRALDSLLTEMANDEIRAFFISIEKQCLIAPYDGGINFILKDSDTKEHYKEKYRDWLSARPDGL